MSLRHRAVELVARHPWISQGADRLATALLPARPWTEAAGPGGGLRLVDGLPVLLVEGDVEHDVLGLVATGGQQQDTGQEAEAEWIHLTDNQKGDTSENSNHGSEE